VDHDEETPEGFEGLELALGLGMLTLAWSKYELALFALFASVLGTTPHKARVIWFGLVSFDLRLRLLRQLAAEGCKSVSDIEAVVDEAVKLAKRRNRFVHWQWSEESSRFILRNYRAPRKPDSQYFVPPNSAKTLARDIRAAYERVSKAARNEHDG